MNGADDEPKAAASQSDDDILDEARKRYQACVDAEGDNRANALDDLLFLTGGVNQWDPKAVEARKRDGRPVITVNTLPTYLHQVTNDQRQNTPSIKVHPVGDRADIETARVRQGMIRHIEYDSNADVAYDTAVNSDAAIGFGFFRLMPEYEAPDSCNQKLVFLRVRNALSVKIDPLSVQADGSDMQYCFVECLMSKDEFKRQYPDAKASSATPFSDGATYPGWINDQNVLLCEYYRIEKTPATVCQLSTGQSGYKDELPNPLPLGVVIVKERESFRQKVMWRKITGADVLETTEIKCKWIPVFPVYGDEIDIEGRVVRSGIIRNAKGPAQSYNVMMSGATEEVALRTKNPYMMAEGQEEGHEDEFAQANNRAFPYLLYKMTELNGHLAPPPQRQPMTDVPVGMLAMAMHARDNVKATTGLFDSSLGAKGTATSGVQEREQQQQGDMANFHYMDGLLRTIRHAGRCLNCMIPHYYDTERVVKILREDDTAEHATINQPQITYEEQPDGTRRAIQSVLNDMTCGEYDITVSAGPTYSTLRQEAAEGMAENMSKNPALWGVIGDLYVKNQDWPGADKMAERIKRTIPPNIIGPEDGEEAPAMVNTPQGPIPAEQASQMLGDMAMQLEQAAEALKQADAAKSQAEAARQQADALKQQHLLGEQQLEPARNAVELKKIEADLAKAIAAERQAEASLLQAQVDMVRAQSEAEMAPMKADTERVVADTAAHQALNPPEPKQPERSPEPAEKPQPLPSKMTIKAPSGMTYEVSLH